MNPETTTFLTVLGTCLTVLNLQKGWRGIFIVESTIKWTLDKLARLETSPTRGGECLFIFRIHYNRVAGFLYAALLTLMIIET